VWLNGHEWAKPQATMAGMDWTPLANGFATGDDPAGLLRICDRLGPTQIQEFFDRWLGRLPVPLTDDDRANGYWWELSMRRIEVSKTIVSLTSPATAGRSLMPWSPTTSTSAGPSRSN
jgi:hypothetical protein